MIGATLVSLVRLPLPAWRPLSPHTRSGDVGWFTLHPPSPLPLVILLWLFLGGCDLCTTAAGNKTHTQSDTSQRRGRGGASLLIRPLHNGYVLELTLLSTAGVAKEPQQSKVLSTMPQRFCVIPSRHSQTPARTHRAYKYWSASGNCDSIVSFYAHEIEE